MRLFAITVLSMLASLVAGESIPGIPSCAQSCIKFGDCGKSNAKCICSDKKLIAELSCCVSKKCDTADQKKTIKFADSICAGQGVNNLPTKASCAGIASISSSSSSANAGATHGVFEGSGLGLVVAGIVAAL